MLTRKLPGFEPDSRLSQLPQQLVAQIKRVPLSWWQWAVVLLLLLILVNSAAKLIWSLLPDRGVLDKPLKATIDLQQQGSGASLLANVDISKLVQLNLFGVAGAVEVVETVQLTLPEDDIDAEETRLALKLTGATLSNIPSASRAMISHNNKQQSYAPGDKLPGGRQVTLDRVLARRVILNNSGRYESLWLFEDSDTGTLLTPAVDSGVNNNAVSMSQPVGRDVSKPVQQPIGQQSLPKTIYPENVPSIESLSEIIRVTPHRKGIQLKPVRNLVHFEQLGLKSGDVVTAVNGREVSLDPEEMRALYLDVLQSQTASFQILRNGKTIDIEVDLDKLNPGDKEFK